MNENDTPTEKSFTELFHRLPVEHAPLGFRDGVMTRIARERSSRWRWEWILAATVAVPNLLFLAWDLFDRGDEIAASLAGIANALLGTEDWDASSSVYVDGILLLAIAIVGLAGLVVTHALLAEERARARSIAA